MVMLKRKNKIQSAGVFVALFPAGAISVLHTFGFWVCPVHISSFHPVSKCFYAFLRAWSCHTPCWLLGWIVEAGNLSGWMWEASVKSQSKAIKGGGKWSCRKSWTPLVLRVLRPHKSLPISALTIPTLAASYQMQVSNLSLKAVFFAMWIAVIYSSGIWPTLGIWCLMFFMNISPVFSAVSYICMWIVFTRIRYSNAFFPIFVWFWFFQSLLLFHL